MRITLVCGQSSIVTTCDRYAHLRKNASVAFGLALPSRSRNEQRNNSNSDNGACGARFYYYRLEKCVTVANDADLADFAEYWAFVIAHGEAPILFVKTVHALSVLSCAEKSSAENTTTTPASSPTLNSSDTNNKTSKNATLPDSWEEEDVSSVPHVACYWCRKEQERSDEKDDMVFIDSSGDEDGEEIDSDEDFANTSVASVVGSLGAEADTGAKKTETTTTLPASTPVTNATKATIMATATVPSASDAVTPVKSVSASFNEPPCCAFITFLENLERQTGTTFGNTRTAFLAECRVRFDSKLFCQQHQQQQHQQRQQQQQQRQHNETARDDNTEDKKKTQSLVNTNCDKSSTIASPPISLPFTVTPALSSLPPPPSLSSTFSVQHSTIVATQQGPKKLTPHPPQQPPPQSRPSSTTTTAAENNNRDVSKFASTPPTSGQLHAMMTMTPSQPSTVATVSSGTESLAASDSINMLEQLVAMGFDRAKVHRALIDNSWKFSRALNQLVTS